MGKNVQILAALFFSFACAEDDVGPDAEFRSDPAGGFGQITVRGDPAPDSGDPSVLQVPAPPGAELWIISGAPQLLTEMGLDSSDMSLVIAAQRLLSGFAEAGTAAVVDVASVVVGEPTQVSVVEYSLVQPLLGDPQPQIWVRLIDDACGGPLPEPGSRWLVYLDGAGDLHRGSSPVAVVEGEVRLGAGRTWSVTALASVLEGLQS